MAVIGFTGTRQLNLVSRERLDKLDELVHSLCKSGATDSHEPGATGLHGCADGADQYFHNVCLKYGVPVYGRPCRFVSDTSQYARMYPVEEPLSRNRKIVEDCAILIAMPIDPENEELRSGTWATIRYCRKAKKQLIVV
jgi:hypothetical protein